MIEVDCPVCGKSFIIPPKNTYKIRIEGKVIHLCSWKCLRAVEKEKEAKKRAKEG